MKLARLLKIIKKHPTWWEESAPGVFQFIMYPLNSFVEQCAISIQSIVRSAFF